MSSGLDLARIDIADKNSLEEWFRRHAQAHLVLNQRFKLMGLQTQYAELSKFTPQWNMLHRSIHLDLCLKAKLPASTLGNLNPKMRNTAMIFAMRNADEHVRLSQFAGL